MTDSPIAGRLLALLAAGKDSALLRFSLGSEFLKLGDAAAAAAHLDKAVEQDSGYSAAWKLLGRARLENNDREGARLAWQRGIAAAAAHGDKQAEREMAVFLRRLDNNG